METTTLSGMPEGSNEVVLGYTLPSLKAEIQSTIKSYRKAGYKGIKAKRWGVRPHDCGATLVIILGWPATGSHEYSVHVAL